MEWFLILGFVGILVAGAIASRWEDDAIGWQFVLSVAAVGVLWYAGSVEISWSNFWMILSVLAVWLVIGAIYAWIRWELFTGRRKRELDNSIDTVREAYRDGAGKTHSAKTFQEYIDKFHTPLAADSKAKITSWVLFWLLHVLGDIFVWPGRWLLMGLRALRGFFDARARAKFQGYE